MKREIKFRGKRKHNGEWVFGYLVQTEKPVNGKQYPYIARAFANAPCNSLFEVIPETVGEYTGLRDINNNKIYTGDLLDIPSNEFIDGSIHEVYFYSDGFVTSSVNFSDKEKANKNSLSWIINRGAAVIGNLYDDPKLIERTKNGQDD